MSGSVRHGAMGARHLEQLPTSSPCSFTQPCDRIRSSMATVPPLPATPSISTCRKAPCQQHQQGIRHNIGGIRVTPGSHGMGRARTCHGRMHILPSKRLSGSRGKAVADRGAQRGLAWLRWPWVLVLPPYTAVIPDPRGSPAPPSTPAAHLEGICHAEVHSLPDPAAAQVSCPLPHQVLGKVGHVGDAEFAGG